MGPKTGTNLSKNKKAKKKALFSRRTFLLFCLFSRPLVCLRTVSTESVETEVDGRYVGGWTAPQDGSDQRDKGRPEGSGRMEWSNGITYVGQWRGGKLA